MLLTALPAGMAVAVALALAGCPAEPAASTCVLEPASLAGNSLTLLAQARLDHTAAGFSLLGTDGTTVEWAALGADGTLGSIHMVTVPDHLGGPWFALAGTAAPADRLVVAFTTASAVPGAAQVPLWAFSVATDGTAGPGIPAVVATVPDARVVPLQLDMRSGRAGMHAALTWAARGAGTKLTALILDGGAAAIGPALELPAARDDFDCLRFSEGRADLTVGYVDLSGTPPAPAFVLSELGADGSAQGTYRMPLGAQTPGCVALTPTELDDGYGLAWHDAEGTYSGLFVPSVPTVSFRSDLVLGDVRLSGAAPAVAGMAYMGKDFAIAVTRGATLEAWRVDPNSRRQGGALPFPSTFGHVGTLSTQAVGAALFATYADYTSEIGGSESVGRRFLVKVTCP